MNQFKEALDRVHHNIEQAKLKSPFGQEVFLLPVSKTQTRDTIQAFIDLGYSSFGENRVQECEEKYDQGDYSDLDIHLLGSLQSNKVKKAVPMFSWIHSVDRQKTLRLINEVAAANQKRINVLFEFNTSAEDQKHGLRSNQELWELFKYSQECEHINLRGLMTIAEYTSNEKKLRYSFKILKGLFEEAKVRFSRYNLDTLSMGMTNDYQIAIEEGSTLVRIGTALFGARN